MLITEIRACSLITQPGDEHVGLTLKGLLHKKNNCFIWYMGPWLPPEAFPLTCYGHKCAHNIGPHGSGSLPTGALKTSQLVPWMSNWGPRNCSLVFWHKLTTAELVAISRAPVTLSGHQLAGFQGTSWQTSRPRRPNTMSTFMHVAGQGKGLFRQPRCPWTYLS